MKARDGQGNAFIQIILFLTAGCPLLENNKFKVKDKVFGILDKRLKLKMEAGNGERRLERGEEIGQREINIQKVKRGEREGGGRGKERQKVVKG